MTQEALSCATGISQPNISQIECGRHDPQLRTLQKIAEALSVHIKELFDDPDCDPKYARLAGAYAALSEEQRKRLIQFLETL